MNRRGAQKLIVIREDSNISFYTESINFFLGKLFIGCLYFGYKIITEAKRARIK